MFQVICIGSASKDIFFPTKEGVVFDTPQDITAQKKIAFELGAKYHIDNRFESLGGCAINVACGLQKLGVSSICYTVLGKDAIGEWILKELEKKNIDTSLIRKENCLTGLSAIIVHSDTGERIIFSNQEANKYLKIKKEKISNFKWISITDPSGNWREVLLSVAEVARENGAKISFNPRGKNITEDVQAVYDFAGKAEIFFVNKDEAIEIITKINPEKINDEKINDDIFILGELKKTGARVVVITDGKRGAWGYDGVDFFHADAMEVLAVDSTGAGDAFSSGFLVAYIKEKSILESLKMGIANGSSVVLYYGAITGLLDEATIDEYVDKVKTEKLN